MVHLGQHQPVDREFNLAEIWLNDFASSWDEDRLAARVRQLPAAGDPLRLPLLLGMVQIDLRQRWRKGRKASSACASSSPTS